jgi:phosphonate transport system permease protein
VINYVVQTIQMAIIGTTLAIFLAAPFGVLAARNVSHPAVYATTRLFLNANRAIPELIFALIFVAAVGLGPFGGVLALGFGSIGFMSKVYAEAIEAIDPQQVLAVRATGANRMQTLVYAVAPQAMPVIASYTLLNFEHNVRSATILGIVGAGGVGFVLQKYLSLFQYTHVMGVLVIVIIVVTVIDRVSDRIRKSLI